MVQIKFKSYNNNLIKSFIKHIRVYSKELPIKNIISLPSSTHRFNVKKSPHVNGRSKENYNFKIYKGACSLGPIRKTNLKKVLSLLLKLNKGGLGLKITLL